MTSCVGFCSEHGAANPKESLAVCKYFMPSADTSITLTKSPVPFVSWDPARWGKKGFKTHLVYTISQKKRRGGEWSATVTDSKRPVKRRRHQFRGSTGSCVCVFHENQGQFLSLCNTPLIVSCCCCSHACVCPSRPLALSLLLTSLPSAPLSNLLNNTSRNSLKKSETQRERRGGKKIHSLSVNHALFKRTPPCIRATGLNTEATAKPTDAYGFHKPHQGQFPLGAAYLWDEAANSFDCFAN